jgi:hypothetical protein
MLMNAAINLKFEIRNLKSNVGELGFEPRKS